MGAKHQSNPESIIKKYSFDTTNRLISEIQKISTQQDNLPPPPIPLAGGGQNTGSGTSFPILYPVTDLGAQGATITINLSTIQSHYQKLEISDPGGNITISFNGLITQKAVLFTLDIVLTSTITHTIIWPSTLYGLPILPTTNGSRYILQIIGYRTSTEERYVVVAFTNEAGSVNYANTQLSNLISPTAVNQDLIPQPTNTRNLGNVNNTWFDVELSGGLFMYQENLTNLYLQIFKDPASNFAIYDFVDSIHNNLGHAFYINSNFVLSITVSAIFCNTDFKPDTDNSFNLGGFDSNGNPLYWFKLYTYNVFIQDPIPVNNHNNNMLETFNSHYMSWNITNASSLTNSGYEWFFATTLSMALVPNPSAGLPYLVLDLENQTTYTNANAGTATALPSNPLGYLLIMRNGVEVKIPYYNI